MSINGDIHDMTLHSLYQQQTLLLTINYIISNNYNIIRYLIIKYKLLTYSFAHFCNYCKMYVFIFLFFYLFNYSFINSISQLQG